jgi:hypothetical protein
MLLGVASSGSSCGASASHAWTDRDDRGPDLTGAADVLPEVMLGPIGLLDDAGAVTAAAVYKLVTVKRRLEPERVNRSRLIRGKIKHSALERLMQAVHLYIQQAYKRTGRRFRP